MAYIRQGNIPNCGGYATEYYLCERAKDVNNRFRNVILEGNEHTVTALYQACRIGVVGADALVNQCAAQMGFNVINQMHLISLALAEPGFDMRILESMVNPVMLACQLIQRGIAQNDIVLNMPQLDVHPINNNCDAINIIRATFIGLNYNNVPDANAIIIGIADHSIREADFNLNNACIELVYVGNPADQNTHKVGNLHYVLSYRNEINQIVYINPWFGVTELRANMANVNIVPSGAGIMLPRA